MKRRVLIIEDDSVLIRGLKDNFTQAGFETLTAMDGKTGLTMALEEDPAIIILDIMLPIMDGYDVCREIRMAEREMPIIMLTANGQEDQIVHGLNAGADDYVTKPFGIRELLARVQAFLRRQPVSTGTITFSGFTFNFENQTLSKGTDTIPLTPKERSLLTLFLKRAGKSLTRERILNHVWSSNMLTTQRSVDRCVNTLRKKIEPDPGNPIHIHSVREFGYRFEC